MKDVRKQAAALMAAAPPLRGSELAAINGIYPAYLFRVRKTREVWATCCGHHEVLPENAPPEARAVLEVPHHPEPKPYDGYCCHMGAMSAPVPKNRPELIKCPWCGHLAKVKELGRTGKRDNLTAWRRVVVLRQWRGALWAVAYFTKKSYEAELTAGPTWELHRVYRFKPGEAVDAGGRYLPWVHTLKGPPDKLPFPIGEPFHWNSEEGMGYTVIGMEELDKGPFRYCQAGAYLDGGVIPATDELIRFLTLCTIWPGQVEMLVKLGLKRALEDLIRRKKWNRAAFDWREPDPRLAFGLDRGELRAWLEESKDLDDLVAYKRFRRDGIKVPFAELAKLREAAGAVMHRMVPKMRRYQVTPAKLAAYIQRESGLPGQKRLGLHTLYTEWTDYIEDAEVLGYDLTNQVYLLPKELHRKHTGAMEPAARIRAARAKKGQEKKERVRQKQLTARYCYSTDRWLIRAPVGVNEIAAEGKALKHCVGGYAERHLSGSTTILFLRDRRRPGKPLVTIEMRGKEITQIHGYWNDRYAKEDPRKEYAGILEPWLAWLAAGSRRDKRGRPIQPRKKKKEVTAA